ncbi:MAG: hypothetical protein OEY22_01740 [Candidatus Bathyarchaeota archaeon]|nr:hypothetical protein [Candidatus Bathyarchaeota archaeon]
MAKFDLGSFIVIILFLYLGGLFGMLVISALPSLPAYVQGILIAVLQMAILSFTIVMAKRDLMTLLWGGILIFIGGLTGGFISQYLDITQFVTFIVLAIQSILLIIAGFTKGQKTPIAKA